jgi:hypothetical protein
MDNKKRYKEQLYDIQKSKLIENMINYTVFYY